MELDSRHYLLKDLLCVASELFRLPRGYRRVLHLCSLGVGLDIAHLLLFIVAAKDSIWNFVEEIC